LVGDGLLDDPLQIDNFARDNGRIVLLQSLEGNQVVDQPKRAVRSLRHHRDRRHHSAAPGSSPACQRRTMPCAWILMAATGDRRS
jgi:hypothetical protein